MSENDKKIDDAIWWYTEMPSDRGAPGRSAGHGRVVRNRIDLDWAELPANGPSGLPAEAPPLTRPLASGKLVLDAASAGDLVVVEKPEGCGISRCRRW